MKKALKVWSRNMVPETNSIIKKCEDSIVAIDLKGEVTPLSKEDVQSKRNNFLQLWKHQKVKEGMWRQKTKKAWINDGDANMKFFHRCVKGKRRQNEIVGIQVGDKYMEQVNEIKEGVANYFENLFTEERWQRLHLDGIEFKKISGGNNSLLLTPFNEEEVKQAMWSCEGSKALGPDGFNFNFIREMWDLIKGDMMGFVHDFHKNGRLVRGANSSFIVLIPKVINPQKIEEFRPISLIEVIYKVIAKLLANRISSVLDSIIEESQMAFIRGRQMVDSIVIANKTIAVAMRNKKASFVFKLDFEKAYDQVCWEFLDYMMSRMGFDPKWRRWINECLKTAEVSVLLNGNTTRQAKINKGLRQGALLSPYLFLLVVEGLNGIISSAINHGLFEGIDIGNRGMIVSHLQFTNDSILFDKAAEGNIWAAKNEWMSKMAYILNYKQGVFLYKYLGVPIGGSVKSIAMWKPLIETFEKKLSSWKGRLLSFGGRITLLNAVLSSLPVFTMSMPLLPKDKEKKISQMVIWKEENWQRTLHWRRPLCEWEEDNYSEMQRMLKNIHPIRDRKDCWMWRPFSERWVGCGMLLHYMVPVDSKECKDFQKS
ncbi:hypothetical protein SLEP1_g29053 [Rubroshorea leprosula]|uniref:Reverse transcriptase domain-containing protein n=1 Tax=Rubroshorea leprosula TaxID=152421 RepID=A0AAV5K500_9ROSI|nr:hypothetical protein SLEP1_g29053 [Rubroshorea leprosula]